MYCLATSRQATHRCRHRQHLPAGPAAVPPARPSRQASAAPDRSCSARSASAATVARSGCFKLRTMVIDAEERRAELAPQRGRRPPLQDASSTRASPVGAVLRVTRSTSCPSCFNVLRGDMSLVGPRPALPNETVGWDAQLYGQRCGSSRASPACGRSTAAAARSFEDYTRLDLYYVDNWSLVTDLAVLARTVPALVLRRGAC